MSCDPSVPSLSVTGKIDYCTARGSCPFPIAWTVREVDNFQCNEPNIPAGPTPVVFTPSSPPAQFLSIETPSPVTVAINGSADTFQLNPGGWAATMEVTSVAITNDLTDPPADVRVGVIFAKGTPA